MRLSHLLIGLRSWPGFYVSLWVTGVCIELLLTTAAANNIVHPRGISWNNIYMVYKRGLIFEKVELTKLIDVFEAEDSLYRDLSINILRHGEHGFAYCGGKKYNRRWVVNEELVAKFLERWMLVISSTFQSLAVNNVNTILTTLSIRNVRNR